MQSAKPLKNALKVPSRSSNSSSSGLKLKTALNSQGGFSFVLCFDAGNGSCPGSEADRVCHSGSEAERNKPVPYRNFCVGQVAFFNLTSVSVVVGQVAFFDLTSVWGVAIFV